MPDDLGVLTELLKKTFPGILTRLADDVRDVKQELKEVNKKIESLRMDEMARIGEKFAGERESRAGEIKRIDLSAAAMAGEISKNRERLTEIEERLRWLSRLVIGALLTGLIGGAIALVFRVAAR